MMIDIKNLTDNDVSREVVYSDGVGGKEFGHITSWNDKFILVEELRLILMI
jgi:hypothetical protein